MSTFNKRRASDVARHVKALLKKNESVDRLVRRVSGKGAGLNPAERRVTSSREDVPVFFVIGVPKSGTTWLMRTLNRHPEVLCLGEGRFFDREMRHNRRKDMQASEHIRFKVQPASLYYALDESEFLRLWIERSVWTRDDDAEEHLKNLTRVAVNYFLTEKLAKTGKSMVGDKTPLSSPNIIREIAEIYPDARVIHIIRDGRDTAISGMHHLWNRSIDKGGTTNMSPEELAKREAYREDPGKFLESGKGIFIDKRLKILAGNWRERVKKATLDGPRLFGPNYAEVRYEDLLQRPHEEFGRLFGFLGANAGERTVARCVKATSFERRTGGRKRGQEDANSGVRKGIAGDWRNVFTERDRDVFKKTAGDLLVSLGYERDSDW